VKVKAIISSFVVTTQMFAPHAFAACALTAEASHTIVRGRFVRCEDASFYLEASGAYQRYERDFEAAVARVSPENRDTFLERLGVTAEFPYDASLDGRVVVVAADWHALIVPWAQGASEAVDFKEAPREIRETIRYWWRGPIETCEAIAEWSSIDLWVYPECCDTPEFGAPVCLINMSYAEPAPDAMSDAISQMVGSP
jgi:hypothetical protein